jgi:hypothetical protein
LGQTSRAASKASSWAWHGRLLSEIHNKWSLRASTAVGVEDVKIEREHSTPNIDGLRGALLSHSAPLRRT